MEHKLLDTRKSTVQIKIPVSLAFRIQDLLKEQAKRAAEDCGKDSVSAAFEASYVNAYAHAVDRGSQYFPKQPEPLPTVKEYRYRHEGWELLRALARALLRRRMAEEVREEAETPRK